MKTLLNGLLKTRRPPRRHPPKPTAGYTMVELVVGMVIAALIITPLLTFVVNVLDSDVKEQAKTNSQQELQAAIDYIAQDMSQAVYVYDLNKTGKTAEEQTAIDNFIAQLPHPPTDDKIEPILVFWKRKFVEDALSPSGDVCTGGNCNDTFVLSLVAYYLRGDDSDAWCQPEGGTCPKRIARFQIQDAVKKLDGTELCSGTTNPCTEDQQDDWGKSDGFNDYNQNPLEWQRDGDYNLNKNKLDVLVNYIEDFKLDSVDGNNKLAKITIVGNALRRSQNDFSCEDSSATPPYKDSPYCPKATAQVGARSGFGE